MRHTPVYLPGLEGAFSDATTFPDRHAWTLGTWIRDLPYVAPDTCRRT
jgi:hypothetical protein